MSSSEQFKKVLDETLSEVDKIESLAIVIEYRDECNVRLATTGISSLCLLERILSSAVTEKFRGGKYSEE